MCTCTPLCPFRWMERRRPSIFASDSGFTCGAKTGKTMGQIASHNVTQFEEQNGRSLGTVGGISDKADKAAAERQDQRMLARKAKK